MKKTHFLSNKVGDFNAKLAEKFEGPYTVYKKVSSNKYDLKSEKGTLNRHIHVKDIIPYRSDSTATNK